MGQLERVYGSIVGAAVGDAMGAVTETKTPDMIVAEFGAYVEDLYPSPPNTFARGNPAGFVTDDFSLAYYTAWELVASKGKVDEEVAEKALLAWAEHPEYLNLAGPTTRSSIESIQTGRLVESPNSYLACDNSRATNGSAMKIFPAGLINPGNPKRAIDDAITLCLPTHSADASLSGAAAVAAAVSIAAAGGELSEVLKAGVEGARLGYELGRSRGVRVSVPSVEKRILLAFDIAERGYDWETTMIELGEIIGAGLMITEAVPSTFGIVAFAGSDLMQAIKMGVNIGNDTDTVATMAGAISGAMGGVSKVPTRFINLVDEVNDFRMFELASEIVRLFYQ